MSLLRDFAASIPVVRSILLKRFPSMARSKAVGWGSKELPAAIPGIRGDMIRCRSYLTIQSLFIKIQTERRIFVLSMIFFGQNEINKKDKGGEMDGEPIDPRWLMKSGVIPIELVNYAGWAGSLCPASTGFICSPFSNGTIIMGLPEEDIKEA
jgi:hypothetical protein